MRAIFLMCAWVTPALIAGMLGWPGIWGGGSALTDYLIPVPVAGGAFHVPSFIALVILTSTVHGRETAQTSWLAWGTLALALTAVAAMLDFGRLANWLFTDYRPHSLIQFEKNPFLLFIASDALWACMHCIGANLRFPRLSTVSLPLVPAVVASALTIVYHGAGAKFDIGPTVPNTTRGQVSQYVYTTTPYDAAVYTDWLQTSSLSKPWFNPNFEHKAILFTNSMDTMQRYWEKDHQATDHIVATLCLYEEDKSVEPHSGFADCFEQRPMFAERLEEQLQQTNTGLGKPIDEWFALVQLCDTITLPEKPNLDVTGESRCAGLQKYWQKRVRQLAKRYGTDSPQIKFMQAEVTARGWPQPS